MRLLPPVSRRRRADVRPRARRVPLLDRVAARAAGGPRPGQRGRARLLRPARRRAARARHRAVRDAVPLGHPAGARGRRRLAGARDRRGVRRVRRDRRGAARRPRAPLDRRTTSRGSTPGSGTPGASTRPGGRASATPSRRRTTSCSRTAGRSRRSGGPRPARRSGSRSTSRTRTRRRRRPRTRQPRWEVDGRGNRWFLDPIFRGAYPADLLERNELVAPLVHDGDLEAMAAPLDFLGVNNYFRARRRRRGRRAALRPRPRGAAHRHGLGGLSRRPARAARCASPRSMRRRRST